MANRENLRIRVQDITNQGLTEFTDRKKISKQNTIDALLAWFLKQDGMLQSLLLGQIDEEYEDQIAEMILNKIADKKHSGRGFKTAARQR